MGVDSILDGHYIDFAMIFQGETCTNARQVPQERKYKF